MRKTTSKAKGKASGEERHTAHVGRSPRLCAVALAIRAAMLREATIFILIGDQW